MINAEETSNVPTRMISDNDEDSIVLEELKLFYINHYHNSRTTFTASQLFAFNYITTKWSNNESVQLIISGEAGTGKSYIIDSLRGYLFENNIEHAVLAYSGSAASIICGNTIHSFFNITADEKLHFKIQPFSAAWKKIKNVKVFLVDEFSMLENKILDGINELLNIMHGSDNKRIFGNMSFLLTGDPAQTEAIDTNIYNNIIFTELMKVITLYECMRQLVAPDPNLNLPPNHGMNEFEEIEYRKREDEEEINRQEKFFRALSNIRLNRTTHEDEEVFYSQVLNNEFSTDGIDDINQITILTSLVHQRDVYNEMCLAKLLPSVPVREYIAVNTGDVGDKLLKNKIDKYSIGSHWKIDKFKLPNILRLKPNCKIILLKN